MKRPAVGVAVTERWSEPGAGQEAVDRSLPDFPDLISKNCDSATIGIGAAFDFFMNPQSRELLLAFKQLINLRLPPIEPTALRRIPPSVRRMRLGSNRRCWRFNACQRCTSCKQLGSRQSR
jgi:hypothetical protein